MRADMPQLRALEQLPDTLEQQGLFLARNALLWAIGGPEAIRREGFAPEEQSDAEIADFFDLWNAQPASEQVPNIPIFAEGSETTLSSVVVGVEVIARVANNHDSIFLAEAILAAFESFLSTSLNAGVFPYRERIEFSVDPAEVPDAAPTLEADSRTGTFRIRHGTGNFGGASDYPALANWLQDVLVRLSVSMLLIPQPTIWLERVASGEAGFGRALALSAVAVATRNIFGDQPNVFLGDWINASNKRYALERDVAMPRRPTPARAWKSQVSRRFLAMLSHHLGFSKSRGAVTLTVVCCLQSTYLCGTKRSGRLLD